MLTAVNEQFYSMHQSFVNHFPRVPNIRENFELLKQSPGKKKLRIARKKIKV
jgi:hypothetical protein